MRPQRPPLPLKTTAAIVLLAALATAPAMGQVPRDEEGDRRDRVATVADGPDKAGTVTGDDGVPHRMLDPRSITPRPARSGRVLAEFWENVRHNLFKPLLLFFYMGFLVPLLKIDLDFPRVLYQSLTLYLLIAIGWHGGEQLALLSAGTLTRAVGFMAVGFVLNFGIGMLAYAILNATTGLRKVDKATVAGFYGSDSAGTFVTCIGALASARIAFDAYMPVLLAVMEIPGCLVALMLVSRLRQRGMDPLGNMPGEPGYNPAAPPSGRVGEEAEGEIKAEPVAPIAEVRGAPGKSSGLLSVKLLREVLLNPGLFLLFGGIAVGFIGGKQGAEVTRGNDSFFVTLFEGVLCLFLLEMGMTASRKLKDLKRAGAGFVLFALLAPNLFAAIGIAVAHGYSMATGTTFQLGTYVLFSVLCAAASYIAVPAVQRLAIPEASPTLPLAASLGLTFTYNVTIGIPVYIEMSRFALRAFPASG